MPATSNDLEPYIIIEGGIVQNDPQLPVFDLDGLVEQDHDWIQNFYDRLLGLIYSRYANEAMKFTPKDLPATLREVLSRAEEIIVDLSLADTEMMAAARADEELLAEIFDSIKYPLYQEQMAQHLARRVLDVIGITVPKDQVVILTDVDPEPGTGQINCSQLQYAVEQYNLATGENLDADDLEEALEWL